MTYDSEPTTATPTTDGWELHAQAQRQNWLQTTPAERLAWLEEAIQFANQHQKAP